MSEGGKRKADFGSEGSAKKAKHTKYTTTNRENKKALVPLSTIEPGNAGIWATCVRGLEARATGQLRDLLDEYAAKLYPESFSENSRTTDDAVEPGDNDEDDIEAAIDAELKDATSTLSYLFKTVKIDIACVLFFKVDSPMDPVHIVHRICQDAAAGLPMKRTRHVNRITPVSLVGKATLDGLSKIGKEVLAPHFHTEDGDGKSFAIRPTVRSHEVLKRQEIIEHVASMVGKKHRVDLTNPQLVILVDVYKFTCGMSVVDGEYEKLKRYNLNELFSSTSDPATAS